MEGQGLLGDEDLCEWCIEHHYALLAVYHSVVRTLTPLSVFVTQGGLPRLSAFDSTHAGETEEEIPRTYKFEDLAIIGITRVRPKAVELVSRSEAEGRDETATG